MRVAVRTDPSEVVCAWMRELVGVLGLVKCGIGKGQISVQRLDSLE
jgi:hypothetical protein